MLKINFFGKKRHKLTKREIARFCGQLKMLLSSGVPLLEALQIIRDMSQQKENDDIIRRISEGESLGKALQEHFPPMVTSSIESAEKAGNLEEVLVRLSQYYEDRAEVEEKVKSALIYPAFVIMLCLISIVVLFLFVLPGFKNLFVDLDADLPFFTQIIMGLGDIFSKIWYIVFFILLASAILLSRYKKSPQGTLVLDRLILRIKFLSREQVIQSFRSLGSLLQGGVPIVEALNITAGSSRNKVFQKIVLEVKGAIENGEKLSAVFSRHEIFPRESIQMLSVGENSGKLSEMLLSISGFYEKEREVFIKRFITLLEPALTLFVGLMVGIIALAMFLPMVNMISKLQ